jgi:tRNA dimethylallyltransferase
MKADTRNVPVLVGPTAVGKTSVSIHLAGLLNAEIISADSRQVYIGLDIGTAKPSPEERRGIPHHLIDVVEIDREFTVSDFQRLALEALDGIHQRGKSALVVGGTGLYVRALVDNPSYQDLPPVPEIRRAILDDISEMGPEAVYAELVRLDPDAAQRIHPNNIPRLVRAVEVIRATGKRFSDGVKKDASRESKSHWQWRIIGLTMDRAALYDRINARVLEMMKNGWLDEVRRVLASGATGDEKPLKGLGYRDLVAHLRGNQSLDKSIDLIQRDTRRFAKRQMTWFRMLNDIHWVQLGPDDSPAQVAESILTLVES